jgi:IS30 family transposase
MSYTHITSSQRNELSALLIAKIKKKDIAKQLNKDRTTIWRELKRNKVDNNRGYDARCAKQKTTQRRISANNRFKKIDNNEWLKKYVIKKIKKYWSPEQISGRLKMEYPNDKSKWIGKDSIYKYIYQQRKDLTKYLRCQKGKYRRRYGTRIREKQREKIKKKRIDQRPIVADLKLRLGDWEGDTVVGKERTQRILTHLERYSGYLIANKLDKVTAEQIRQITIKNFNKLPRNKRHTITYDNGSEFSEYELISKELKTDIYFAYPYHSWERGANENVNGLLRQFFPKKSFFATINQEQVKVVVKLINNRPRKRLNYLTPYEVFYNKKSKI